MNKALLIKSFGEKIIHFYPKFVGISQGEVKVDFNLVLTFWGIFPTPNLKVPKKEK